MKNLLKYPSPVTARNPDEQKFVPPSSSTKMWPAYVSLHKVFPFHLKIRCTVEFSLAMCVTSVTKLWKRADFFEPWLLLRPGMKIETVDVSWNFTIPPLEFRVFCYVHLSSKGQPAFKWQAKIIYTVNSLVSHHPWCTTAYGRWSSLGKIKKKNSHWTDERNYVKLLSYKQKWGK